MKKKKKKKKKFTPRIKTYVTHKKIKNTSLLHTIN